VNGLLDLNQDSPHLGSLPIPSLCGGGEVREFTKKNLSFFTCLICLRGRGGGSERSGGGGGVGFHLKLPRTAFVPGEYIQFVADMRNMSPVDVSGVTLSLIQVRIL
jgi:hypothetical protein